MNNKRKENQNR